MKFSINTVLVILMSFTAFSCNSQTSSSKQTTIENLVLNGTERWKANEATIAGIHNISDMLENFTDTENVNSYKQLSKNLQKEFYLIFQNCTMTGESHNQLHHYLHPLKVLIESVESDDLKEAMINFEKVEYHLNEFDEYFK